MKIPIQGYLRGWVALVATIGLAGCDTTEPGETDGGADTGSDAGGDETWIEPVCATEWRPVGVRAAAVDHPLLPSREAFRNLHGDLVNSDEVSIAIAPVFEAAWVAEPDTFHVTGPVFDSAGNLYLTPLLPHEDVLLISVEPVGGARRWAIPGDHPMPGGGAAMVLNDQVQQGEELIYLGLYDRVLAVRTNGTIVWDQPTGLILPEDLSSDDGLAAFGLGYLPGADAIAGLTQDGHIYILDRVTGQPLLAEPYQLPGEKSPAGSEIPFDNLTAAVIQELAPLIDLPEGSDEGMIDVLMGNGTEVANFFSVDPHLDRLWIAATAPDDADGVVDGISELGALYGLDVVLLATGGVTLVEQCHRTFAGGSASTPALALDGSRVYVGDNNGKVIAIGSNCDVLWELELEQQIVGSLAVSADNGEIYASNDNVTKIIDHGTSGEVVWTVVPQVLNAGPDEGAVNLNLVTIGANGLAFQAGAGRTVLNGYTLIERVGVGLLNRESGAVRHFAEGLDETVSVIAVGPDGGIYIGNSPLRRAIANALPTGSGPTLVGGITKFAPQRPDLHIADIACAGATRAANAHIQQDLYPLSATADQKQLFEHIAQARRVATAALTAGQMDKALVEQILAQLVIAETALQNPDRTAFKNAANALAQITHF